MKVRNIRTFAEPIRRAARGPDVTVIFGRLGAITPDTALETSASAIDFSFLGHAEAGLRRAGGRQVTRRIAPLTASAYAAEPTRFERLAAPSEYLEVRTSEALRRSVCEEMGVPDAVALGEVEGLNDPVLTASAFRLRGGVMTGTITPEAVEEAGLRLAARVVRLAFGGRLEPVGSLDERRLVRVRDYAAANLAGDLSLDRLAEAACLSRFHFLRAFRRRSGVTPSAYVAMLRTEHARCRLLTGSSVADAAASVGYRSSHAFRSAFRAAFGHDPGRVRAEAVTSGPTPSPRTVLAVPSDRHGPMPKRR